MKWSVDRRGYLVGEGQVDGIEVGVDLQLGSHSLIVEGEIDGRQNGLATILQCDKVNREVRWAQQPSWLTGLVIGKTYVERALSDLKTLEHDRHGVGEVVDVRVGEIAVDKIRAHEHSGRVQPLWVLEEVQLGIAHMEAHL
jgi:hypothetical protein